MKLSGHSYDNDLFNSLLDNLKDDIVLKKPAEKQASAPITGMDVFSSNTESNFDAVLHEELEFIAKELEFAADRAKIAVNVEDLAKFATQARSEGLRGKKLERAAQKYCNQLDRAVAEPIGTTRSSDRLINQLASHAIAPAGYPADAEGGQNNSATGKFMGCSKNPNTIFDSGALERFASVKHGDEMIKQSKAEQKEHRLAMKQAQWQELQDKHSDPNQVHKGIIPAGDVPASDVAGNQNLPANTMSIFSAERDFQNIPKETLGEKIASMAKDRAEKRGEAKSEWNKVEPAKKNSTRSWIDNMFDGLAS